MIAIHLELLLASRQIGFNRLFMGIYTVRIASNAIENSERAEISEAAIFEPKQDFHPNYVSNPFCG